MAYLLGIDAGTSSLKVVLFDEQGTTAAESDEEYQLLMPAIDMVELDVNSYWQICVRGIQRVLQNSKIDKDDIKALSISSQGETFVPVDKDGIPLRNAIVESDNRSTKEAQIIREEFGDQKLYEVTGQPYIFPSWMGTKILWLKNNEPEVYTKAHKFLLVEDYLIYKFTGEFVCEHSLICSSLVFDIRRKKWWPEMLNLLDITGDKFGAVKSSGEIIGPLTSKAAKETGLAKDTLVVTGALDQAAAMIGSGNIKTGIITESTGTVLAICATMKEYKSDSLRRSPIHCHAVHDSYYLLPWCRTAGVVLKWLRDNFCQEEINLSKENNTNSYEILSYLAEKVPAGSEGLIMLPHFLGAIYPEFNAEVKGAFFGVTLQHTKAHFIRVIMEAVAYMLRRNLEVFQESGIAVDEIKSLGGASKSELWCRIKADVTGKPVVILENSEVAASLGAAILAGTAVGVYASLEEGCQRTVKVMKKIKPNHSNEEVYNKNYQMYLNLYDAVKGLF